MNQSRIADLVSGVRKSTPLAERLADLDPLTLSRIEAAAKEQGVSPEDYWRRYRAQDARERTEAEAARTIARTVRRH